MATVFYKQQEREFFAHHMLLHAASLEVEQAERRELGQFNKCLAAMVLSALAVEALANAVGTKAGIYTDAFERASPLDKIDRLVAHLRISRVSTREPWTTVRYIVRFRNAIAHPKPETVITKQLLPEAALEKQLFDTPLSKLEREISVGNARRVYRAVEKLKVLFEEALPEDQRLGIFGDVWSGTTGIKTE